MPTENDIGRAAREENEESSVPDSNVNSTSNTRTLLIAYTESVRENRRILENQERRLYSLLAERVLNENISSGPEGSSNSVNTNGSYPPSYSEISIGMTSPPAHTPFNPYSEMAFHIMGAMMADDYDGGSNVPSHDRPTEEQITNATELIPFGEIEDPVNDQDPISQVDFGENDEVMCITHCRHLFIESNIRQWFTTHSECPICRYDIRTPVREGTE